VRGNPDKAASRPDRNRRSDQPEDQPYHCR